MPTRIDRISAASASYEHEYSELCDNWRALDQKAQGALQIGGLMIALLAGFGPKLCEQAFIAELPTWIALTIGCVAFVLLTLSVWFALLGLWIQCVDHPPRGTGWCDIKTLVSEAPVSDEVLCDITYRQLSEWRDVNEQIWMINGCKASWLERSQSALLAGVCAVTLAAMAFIVGQAWAHAVT
jgi:hypothetical protein